MIEVLKTGLYDTIQDLGRYNVQELGVPISGAMDLYSTKVANTVLGNSIEDAVLEITIIGPKLQFHCNTEIALSGLEKHALISTEYVISKDSNRMAYQVNEILENEIEPIITSLVLPGTVQLTPYGKLLVLMRDCQITGGYPRVLQISETSINQLSQKVSGDKFRFKCID